MRERRLGMDAWVATSVFDREFCESGEFCLGGSFILKTAKYANYAKGRLGLKAWVAEGQEDR